MGSWAQGMVAGMEIKLGLGLTFIKASLAVVTAECPQPIAQTAAEPDMHRSWVKTQWMEAAWFNGESQELGGTSRRFPFLLPSTTAET